MKTQETIRAEVALNSWICHLIDHGHDINSIKKHLSDVSNRLLDKINEYPTHEDIFIAGRMSFIKNRYQNSKSPVTNGMIDGYGTLLYDTFKDYENTKTNQV